MEEEELRNRWRRGGQIEYLEEKLKIAKPEPQWTDQRKRDTHTHERQKHTYSRLTEETEQHSGKTSDTHFAHVVPNQYDLPSCKKLFVFIQWMCTQSFECLCGLRFNIFKICLLCSSRLHLLNVKKYNKKKLFSIWMHFKMQFFPVMQSWFISIIRVTWSSEIILIYWFDVQETSFIIINVKNSCAASYFCRNLFRFNVLMKRMFKSTNIKFGINVFTVTFEKCYAFLMNKGINYLWKWGIN